MGITVKYIKSYQYKLYKSYQYKLYKSYQFKVTFICM